MVPHAGTAFDGEGNLIDAAVREKLARFVAGFVESISR